MFIILAILLFGLLIAVHELGHFLTAKACGVRVLEFAIGMGPVIVKRQRGETLYSWRCLPIGGFCSMEGEDESSSDPRAFSAQPGWKKFLILVAGAAMNFLLGLLIVVILYSSAGSFTTARIDGFMDGCPYQGEQALMEGDRIVRVDGHRIYYMSNFANYITQGKADGRHDIVLIRDGQRVELKDFYMVPVPLQDETGATVQKYGLLFAREEATVGSVLRYSVYTCVDFTRMVWDGLRDLITGAVGVSELSGVVGIVSLINDVGQQAEKVQTALYNIAYLTAFIAVNLAVMNLLPIPALDGGRVLFLLIDFLVLAFTRRRLDPKYEGYVNTGGFVLLMALMVFVMYNDVMRLIR